MPGSIRVKNKHIMYFIIILMAVTLLSYLLLPGVLYRIAAYYDRKFMPFHAQVYYQRIIDYLPFKSDAYLRRGKHLADLYLNNFHITHYPNSGTMWQTWLAEDSLSREETHKKALLYFEECLNRGYLETTDIYRSPINVLEYMVPLLILEGRLLEAENLLDEYPGKLPAPEELSFRNEIALRQEDGAKALTTFHGILQENSLGALLDEAAYLGRGLVGLGAYREAQEYYAFLLEEFPRLEESRESIHETAYLNKRWVWQKEFDRGAKVAADLLAGAEALGRVEGRATREGEPVEGLEVRLRFAPLEGIHYKNRQIGGNWGEPHPPAVTDAEGNFHFEDVYPGSYTVGLRIAPEDFIDLYTVIVGDKDLLTTTGGKLSPENPGVTVKAGETMAVYVLLRDTITVNKSPGEGEKVEGDIYISWEPYPEAVSYSLFIGGKMPYGSWTSLYQEGIRETEITITVDDLYDWVSGSMGGGKDGVHLHSLLGLRHPEGEVLWYINAHDEEGVLWEPLSSSKTDIGTSQSYSFFIPAEYNHAEKLLLAGRTRKAVEEFKKILEIYPDDTRALRPLAYLYAYGHKDFPQDKEQAKFYFTELYRVTGKEWLLDQIESLTR